MEREVYDAPSSPILKRKKGNKLIPIPFIDPPKSDYELAQEKNIREKQMMKEALFQNKTNSPEKVNPLPTNTFLQQLASIYESDSD